MGITRRDRVTVGALGADAAISAYGREAPIVREYGCSRAALRSLVGIVVLCGLLGGAGQHGGRVVDLEGMQRASRAARLVDDTVAALAAYPFDTVKGLHGCSLHEREMPDASEFKVELAVTVTSADLLKIEGVLMETRDRRAVSQFVTYRGRT